MFGLVWQRNGTRGAAPTPPGADSLADGDLMVYWHAGPRSLDWVWQAKGGDLIVGNGHLFAGREAALERLRRYGPSALHNLDGEFALAWWDVERQQLTAGTDLVGTRPLYIARNESCLAIGNDAASVLRSASLPLTIDRVRFQRWCAGDTNDAVPPLIHLQALVSGERLTATRSGLHVQGGYRAPDPTAPTHREELASDLRRLLGDVVADHMVGAEKVAVTLTSGVDSNAIVGTVRTRHPQVTVEPLLQTFPGYAFDEEPAAAKSAESWGLSLHALRSDRLPHPASIPSDWQGAPGPTFLWNSVWPAGLLAYARRMLELDVRCLLVGEGADLVLGSCALELNHPPPDLTAAMRWLPSERARSWFQLIAHEELILHAPRLLNSVRSLRRQVPDWLSGYQPSRRLLATWSRSPSVNAHARMALGDPQIRAGVQFQIQLAERAGIDLRLPFLDRRLVSWALGVPRSVFERQSVTKHLFREAVADLIPKASSSAVTRGWRRFHLTRGRDPIEELLERGAIRNLGIVRTRPFLHRYDEALRGVPERWRAALTATSAALVWAGAWFEQCEDTESEERWCS